MKMVRGLRPLLVAELLGALPALAIAAPEQIQVADATLRRAGQATREELLVDLYQNSLHLLSKDAGMERIPRQSVPKAFHVEVLYDGSFPGDIPQDWAEELLQSLSDRKMQELRQVYQT